MMERVERIPTSAVPNIARLTLEPRYAAGWPAVRPAMSTGVFVIEAVASSAIEGIYATVPQALLALTNPRHPAVTSAGRSVAANAQAVISALSGAATYSDHRRAHDTLMAGQHTREYGGGLRSENVSIGGHIAPAPRRLPGLIDDLVSFVGSHPADTQHAAVAHAQFESIHPYPDGNGRIGRALLAGHLRAPVSVHLGRNRYAYYDALRDYRLGDAGPIVRLVAAAEQHGIQLAVEARGDTDEAWGAHRLGAHAQRLSVRLRRTPVGTRQRMLGRGHEKHDAAFDELVDARVVEQASEDLGELTVYRFNPLISTWASLANTQGPGATRSERHWKAAISC
jgi:hypothetical protein